MVAERKDWFSVSSAMKYLLNALLCAALLLLNSCIDGDEEIFLRADGGARVLAIYRVPTLLLSVQDAEDLRSSIEKEVGSAKNLKLLTNKVEKHQGNRVITFEIETDDVMALEGVLAEHDPALQMSKGDKILHAIIGRMVVNIEGFSVKLIREVQLEPLLDEYLGSNGASMLGDSTFRYTVHLPDAAESSNAHEVFNEGRTLKWTHKLIDSSTSPIIMTLTAPIPIPWWVFVLAALFLAAAIWSCYVLMARSRAQKYAAGSKK